MNICCIIPIKHISERFPGKNYRPFQNKPLFQIILDKLLRCKIISTIVIDTNSPVVKKILEKEYQNKTNIILYHRPQHLCGNTVSTNTLLENVISALHLDYDIYLQTHVTNPLLTISTIEKCINTFQKQSKNGYDSLMTVKKIQNRFYTLTKNNKVHPINHNLDELIPTQQLDPLYEENSCLYIFTKYTLFQRHHRVGYNPYLYIMSSIESIDIDYESDFVTAESLYKTLQWKNDKIVLITGCDGGIGTELCKTFQKKGWTIVGTSDKKMERSDFTDFFLRADLNDVSSAEHIISEIKNRYNRLDCIIHNAAVQICKPVETYSTDDWKKTFQINVFVIQQLVQESLEMLKQSKGNIVNISSIHSSISSEHISCYAASKASVVALTRNLCLELGKYKIRVNCISPGAVQTPMLHQGLLRNHEKGSIDELLEQLKTKHVLGEIGEPFEIANLVEFVANDENGRFLNGSNIVIDGGVTTKLSTE